MPRSRQRGSRGGKTSAKKAPGRAKKGRTKKSTTGKSKDVRQPWDASDEECDERFDYYTDSSEDESDRFSPQKRQANVDCDYEDDDEATGDGSSVTSASVGTSSVQYVSSVSLECPWADIPPECLPDFVLPKGSRDLLINEVYLFDALEVYEVCRCYYQLLHLSPFLFEDFCAALTSEGQTNLLAEVHIALLKAALKDDEDEQVILSVQDTNNSFNIMLQVLDPMTYGEVLRQYVESDPQRFPADVMEACSGNYPFVGVKQRLKVLSFLCDRFLNSSEYRKMIRNDGKLVFDEDCRECGKPGDVLLCDGCEACYHIECTKLTTVPEGKWLCQVCELHMVRGVTDCDSNLRSQRLPMRFQPLGYDRHGRRYWFAVRRIFIQDDSNGSLRYYSTLPQLHELLSGFSVADYEKHLSAVFMDLLPTINEHMRITLDLTNEYGRSARARLKTDLYLHADNVVRMGTLLYGRALNCTDSECISVVIGNGKVVEVSKHSLMSKSEELLGFVNDKLGDTYWTAGFSEHELVAKRDAVEFEQTVASINGELPESYKSGQLGFRLGEGETLKRYVNQYSVNEYAKSPHQRTKERDKKKYMCGRFSLMDEGEFEWETAKKLDVSGSENETGLIIQNSMEAFARRLPTVLMHRAWKREGLDDFRKSLASVPSVQLLRDTLLRFECAMRKSVFQSVWWSSLGHTRLMRITVDDREWWQRYEAKKKKQERELLASEPDEDDVVWVHYMKIGPTLRRTLFRQNGESYRLVGRGALGGWLWKSNTLRRCYVPRAEKPTIDDGKKEPTLANRKAERLDKIVKRLNEWRNVEHKAEEELWERGILPKCYSPTCRQGFTLKPVSEGCEAMQRCYSFACREAVIQSMQRSTSGVVHARPQSNKQKNGDSESDKLFPLPKPFDYRVRKTGQQSLLVLPQRVLKRIARQGGVNFNYSAPGFHRTAKSNIQVWNYPCQRPLFDNCWRYLTLRAPSYHAIALQLRILYACVRWTELQRDPDEDLRVITHHADHDEVRTVIGHKEHPPDGTYEQYLLQVELIPLDDGNEMDVCEGIGNAAYHPGRGYDPQRSVRRKKAATKKIGKGMQRLDRKRHEEKWVDGTELKLWEIIDYWKSLESRARRGVSSSSGGKLETGDRRKMTPLVTIIPEPPYLSRGSAEKRRPVAKRYADYDYDVKEEDDGDSDEDYIDVTSVDSGDRNLDPPKPKVRKVESPIVSQLSARERLYESRAREERINSPIRPPWQNTYKTPQRFVPQNNVTERPPIQLRGAGKFAYIKRPDNTYYRVPMQSTATSSSLSPSTSNAEKYPISEAVSRLNAVNDSHQSAEGERSQPAIRRLVVQPSTSTQFPARPLGQRIFVIRRSDGTKQYLRPVLSANARGAPAVIRANQAVASPTAVNVRNAGGSGSLTTQHPARSVVSGSSSRIVRVPVRSVPYCSSQPSSSTYSSQQPARTQRVIYREFPVPHRPLLARSSRATSIMPIREYALPSALGVRQRDDELEREYQLLEDTDTDLQGSLHNRRYISSQNDGFQTVEGSPLRQGSSTLSHTRMEQTGRHDDNYDPMVESEAGLSTSSGTSTALLKNDQQTRVPVRQRTYVISPRKVPALHPLKVGNGDEVASSSLRPTASRLHELADAATSIGREDVDDASPHFSSFDGAVSQMVAEMIEEVSRGDELRRNLDEIYFIEKKKQEEQKKTIEAQRIAEERTNAEIGERIQRYKNEIYMRRFKLMDENAREIKYDKIESWSYDPSKKSCLAKANEGSMADVVDDPRNISLGGTSKTVTKNVYSLAETSEFIETVASSTVQYQVKEESIGSPTRESQVKGTSAGRSDNNSRKKGRSSETSEKTESCTGKSDVSSRITRRSGRSRRRKNFGKDFTTTNSKGQGETMEHPVHPRKRKYIPPPSSSPTTSHTGTASPPVPEIDVNKRHCFCNQPYNPKRFYVACDLCSRWFHGKCIGINEKKSKTMTTWVCEDCAKERQNSEQELYCFCQQPYDESRFYVGCDGCEGWYHLECVNMSQEEVEKTPSYLCPKCMADKQKCKPTLQRGDYGLLWEVLGSLMEHRTSWPFREKVDVEQYPDYYMIIKKPMDLSIVERKLQKRQYKSLEDFTADITQIFENARTYNSKESAIYQCAGILEKIFLENLIKVRAVIEDSD